MLELKFKSMLELKYRLTLITTSRLGVGFFKINSKLNSNWRCSRSWASQKKIVLHGNWIFLFNWRGGVQIYEKTKLELKWKLSLAKIENLDSWLIYGGFCLKTFFFWNFSKNENFKSLGCKKSFLEPTKEDSIQKKTLKSQRLRELQQFL